MGPGFGEGAALGAGHAVGKALGEAALDQVTTLVKDFLDQRNGFLGNDAREGIREARRLTEYDLYRPFFGDPSHHDCFLAGLHLRKIAKDQPRVKSYRSQLHEQYGVNGLHIAEAVQADVLPYLRASLERHRAPTDFHNRMVELFQDISAYVLFVKGDDNESYETEHLRKRLKLHGPPAFVVAGSGGATSLARNIAMTVRQKMEPEYGLRTIEDEHRTNFVLYLK